MYHNNMSKNVALKYVEEYNTSVIEDKLREALFDLDLNQKLKPKMKVLIKADLHASKSPDLAETTNPNIVHALVNILSEMGIKCVLADCPYGKFNDGVLDDVYLNTGMLEVANLTNCELNNDLHTCELEIPQGKLTKREVVLSRIFDVDGIINVGKLKFDDRLGYQGCVANLFGFVPGELKTIAINRMDTIEDYNNYLLDLYSSLNKKILFNVLDGIATLEARSTPRLLSCLAVSDNAFAIDSTMLDILSIPKEESIIKTAIDRYMYDYDTVRCFGEKPSKFIVEDFQKTNITNETQIHLNKRKQQRYYNSHQARVKINPHNCKGCGICSEICPTGAIMMRFDKLGELEAVVDYKKCIHCYKCRTACPYHKVEMLTPAKYKAVKKEIDKQNT